MNNRKGILLMIAAIAAFAVQDAFSRLLAGQYNTLMVVMIRYWVFAAFVMTLALRRPEGIRAALRTNRPIAQALRAILLVVEICVMVYAYTLIGLINAHAVFAVCPLIVVALSGPILGERLTWQRWATVGVGLIGVLIILRPGQAVFSWPALLPLITALFFAAYSVLTRLTARDEPFFASFFWPAFLGAILMTALGLPHWHPIQPQDYPIFAAYAVISILSNWLLQKTYEVAEASAVQPFAYLHFVFIALIGVSFFDETLALPVVLGAALIIAAGIYALWQAPAVSKVSL
ncbi:MAG: family transporter [Cypionkella sp.]|uniref:DMT family transporter n=1 Tax=Cypionkella sp. TaxID=2811411 RepID=UPI002608E490|nr:DMT family transporter [Cypionkella sp.]MDB5661125.1 family transporter [Cypionkella sp.]